MISDYQTKHTHKKRAKNRVERSGTWSGRGRKWWSGSGTRRFRRREQSGERAELATHNLLQPNIFNDFITYIVRIELSAHSFTLHALALIPVQTRPNLIQSKMANYLPLLPKLTLWI